MKEMNEKKWILGLILLTFADILLMLVSMLMKLVLDLIWAYV